MPRFWGLGKLIMETNREWNRALSLAVITVFYNIVEGLVSVYFGIEDESLSLFGFGIDSFIEVLSGIGVWHMIVRIRKNHPQDRDAFEKRALQITGLSFYILTAGLLVTVAHNIYTGHQPQTTIWGIIISLISILTMVALTASKLKVGHRLNSQAIIADAHCTKTCVHLSIVLLLSSLLSELFKIGYFDSLGALGIAWLAFKEGSESMEKAKGKACCSCTGKSCH